MLVTKAQKQVIMSSRVKVVLLIWVEKMSGMNFYGQRSLDKRLFHRVIDH